MISIANTQNLPELLQAKITSRIGNTRLVYEPYSSAQIQIILESRLRDIDIFSKKSIALVCKKVAQYTGDIRRALQVTKRAVEIAREQYERSGKGKTLLPITIDHVLTAFKEMQSSKTVNVLRGLRKFEVIVIIALFLELQVNRVDRILMERVQQRCDDILWRMKTRPVSALSLAPRPAGTDNDPEDSGEEKQEMKRYSNWQDSALTTTMFREIVKRL